MKGTQKKWLDNAQDVQTTRVKIACQKSQGTTYIYFCLLLSFPCYLKSINLINQMTSLNTKSWQSSVGNQKSGALTIWQAPNTISNFWS